MRALTRLAAYSWKHKRLFVAAYAAMTCEAILYLIIPLLLGRAIDQVLLSGSQARLYVLVIAIVLVSVMGALSLFGVRHLTESLSQWAVFDLRNDLFDKLQSLSLGFHDRENTGRLMSKLMSDVEEARRFLGMGLMHGPYLVVYAMVVSAILFATNWLLALTGLVVFPLIVWRSAVIMPRVMNVSGQAQAELGNMTTILEETLSGIRVIKAFGASQHQQAKFDRFARAVEEHMRTAGMLAASHFALSTFMYTTAVGVILWIGVREILSGRLSEGEMTAAMLYMGLLAMPAINSGALLTGFARAAAAASRLVQILDSESPVKEKTGARRMSRARGSVRFDGVSVTYDAGSSALHGISFRVQPGQLVAVLGHSGSGKSTIAHLLARFYDVSEGRVTIDDVDVRDVTLSSLRRNVGIISQDVFVFTSTLKENIAYGVPDASMDDVVRAAKVAQLHEFIESLPRGYDTWVGEGGVTLSGGQRQRLTIARTILADPAILILDDSTSNVDVPTDQLIQRELNALFEGRTSFVIAHRLPSIREADLILVLDQGRIVERGSHDDLMNRDGFYRRSHDNQFGPDNEPSIDPTQFGGVL